MARAVIGFPKDSFPRIRSGTTTIPPPARCPTGWRRAVQELGRDPGPEVDALCAAARDANAYVVIGVCEKIPNTTGTMFNTRSISRRTAR
jgi:hypothetical protein